MTTDLLASISSTFLKLDVDIIHFYRNVCIDIIRLVPDDRIILLLQALVHFVQLVPLDELDVGEDLVLVAEVDAVLGLLHPADQGAGYGDLLEQEAHLGD